MKNIIVFLILFLPISLCYAQDCNDETHTTNINDSWSSCTLSVSPNPVRTNVYWLMYDLGHVYTLDSTKFWNYNVNGNTDKGMKNITIDYSTNATTWTEAAVFQLGEAPGQPDYEGETGPALGNISARYILMSSTDNWGDPDCVGLSELRLYIGGSTTNLHDLYADESKIILYPNPTSGYFTIHGTLDNYDVKIMDVTGNIIQNLSGASTDLSIDLSALPNGMYFIGVSHQSISRLHFQKIIKQ